MRFFSILTALFSGNIKGHFGQYGEDILIHKIFSKRVESGFYVDIGSFHPYQYSNTAYLWLKGWSGINVDANARSIMKFNKVRPNDINIHAAVIAREKADSNKTTQIYTDCPDTESSSINPMGTVDEKTARARGFLKTTWVPALKIDDVLKRAPGNSIDFLNMDIEGLDETIIQEIDFLKYQPKLICIEDSVESISELIHTKITKKLTASGYSLDYRIGPSSIFRLASFKID